MKRPTAPLIGLALLGASACARSSYMGISMIPGAADRQVQALAVRAQAGDKQAQLDLGIRFEEGKGVPQDTARAVKLYQQAASDSGGRMWVYAPSPGNGAPARAIPIDRGPRQKGLEEAKRRANELVRSKGT
ncbi:SEL1-like repeat protein [Rhizorhapis suberifaciens]|uniref:TPR repeat protein n=1 Tax=Rhizorhapis suberifaciens TaxID=13656 RepID=A0A840HZ00_9SPHN|nr:SEL1-like repeat protein [Rhizorhapis suberifaciens]MBB4642634.1 TPR repeat protein [Rhizorhapis suberifaciens]